MITIQNLCDAYDKEYPASRELSEAEMEDPNYFYAETYFDEKLMKVDATKLTAEKFRRMLANGLPFGADDSYMYLSGLFSYAFNRGLIPVAENPAEVVYMSFNHSLNED
jgi:hypothetical protein